MGIWETRSFRGKVKEAKRQLDNARRAKHADFRDTKFRLTNKDTTPQGSGKKPQTLPDIEKELDRLYDTAPIRPPKRVSEERENALKTLSPEKIKWYKEFYKNRTIDDIELEISTRKKMLHLHKEWKNDKRSSYQQAIVDCEFAINIKNLESEKAIHKNQIEDFKERKRRIVKLQQLQKENVSTSKEDIIQENLVSTSKEDIIQENLVSTSKEDIIQENLDKNQVLDKLREFHWWLGTTSEDASKKSEATDKYFDSKIEKREKRLITIDNLLLEKGDSTDAEEIISSTTEINMEGTFKGKQAETTKHKELWSLAPELELVSHIDSSEFLSQGMRELQECERTSVRPCRLPSS